jgi:hypothetical protein
MFRHRLDTIVFPLTDPVQSQFEVIFVIVIVIVESPQQTIFLSSPRGRNHGCTSNIPIASSPLKTSPTLHCGRDPILERELHFSIDGAESMWIGS